MTGGTPFLAQSVSATRVAAEKPSPAHLIVGSAISLPSVLLESGQPGSSPLVTAAEARVVETTMWRIREQAAVESDTRAFSQLTSPGPALEGFINNCAFPGGQCVPETKPREINSLQVIVPVQRSYPIYFLAEVQTTQSVTMNSGLNDWEPWMELQILTKASPSASWKVSFDSGYDATTTGAIPPTLPFALQPVADPGSGEGGEDYNPSVTSVGPTPASKFLPLLAAYWQSYKDTGHAPANTVFVADGETTGEGADLAQNRQGAIYAGTRQTYEFQADTSAGSWLFAVSGGYAMECGFVLDNATNTAVSGYMNQNSDESNYGPPLPPGEYRQITTAAVHETCVYVVQGGLDAAGNDIDTANVSGSGFVGVPDAPKSTPLSDLETQYGVLAGEVVQDQNVLYSCRGSATTCEKTFASDSQQQFANFANQLDELPASTSAAGDATSSAAGDIAGLLRTTTELAELYGKISGGTQTSNTFAMISTDSTALANEYVQLVSALT
jgi:hypothetical protein